MENLSNETDDFEQVPFNFNDLKHIDQWKSHANSISNESNSTCFNFEEKLNNLLKLSDIEDILFDALANEDGNFVNLNTFWNCLKSVGIDESDPRLTETYNAFRQYFLHNEADHEQLVDRNLFRNSIQKNILLIVRAFKKHLIIPDFEHFKEKIQKIFDTCKENKTGEVASYIPQLARVDPNMWAVSVCTIDGQRIDMGDSKIPFCIQSCCKPLNYAISLTEHNPEYVHKYVGCEPSGQGFNELTLDINNKPHNPMINAGAIVICSLIKRQLCSSDRFDFIFNQYKKMSGNQYVGFSNSIYLSERDTADRNFAMGYFMRQHDCFPKNTDLLKTLELYFQLCSIEFTSESGSIIAATLANSGICPITGDRVMDPDAVRNTLSLMHSCGMYDYSGRFAFRVGLPAKSGVSGAILLVIPNVMGMCIWSPPLDKYGNCVRGVQFCEIFTNQFSFHNYDNLTCTSLKVDPRRIKQEDYADDIVNMLCKASEGDVKSILRYRLMDKDLSASDYDGRTALHVASADGQYEVVKILIQKCNVDINPIDRWGRRPIDDAIEFKHEKVEKFLKDYMENSSGVGDSLKI